MLTELYGSKTFTENSLTSLLFFFIALWRKTCTQENGCVLTKKVLKSVLGREDEGMGRLCKFSKSHSSVRLGQRTFDFQLLPTPVSSLAGI